MFKTISYIGGYHTSLASPTILLEAIGWPSMTIIEVGQGSFSKAILCVEEKSRSMKQELAPVLGLGTWTMVLLDVLTWTRVEKTLLSCLDNMEPLPGIGWNDLWLPNQMASILNVIGIILFF